jgi:hypothetical protein
MLEVGVSGSFSVWGELLVMLLILLVAVTGSSSVRFNVHLLCVFCCHILNRSLFNPHIWQDGLYIILGVVI